jgi:cell division protein FtsA
MSKTDIVAGVDIGSAQVACVIGRRDPQTGQIEVLSGSRTACPGGLKGGVVININETARAVTRICEEAEDAAKEMVKDVTIAVRGSHLQTFNNHGALNIARTDKEITADDVEKAIESAQAIHLSADREIIHTIPQGFTLDRQQGVPNPVGMEGSLLEVEVHIVTAGSSHLNNVWRAINNAGFAIKEPVYGLLALGDVVVTQEEKDLGCVLVDLGGSTTGIAIYTDGGVRFTKELSIGADAITNDLAHGLRTAVSQAKLVKERYGAAIKTSKKQVLVLGNGQEETVDMEEEVSYTSVDGRTQRQIQRNTLFDFIAPRVEEIFSLVKIELENSGMAEQVVSGGLIVTGGGSMMPGLVAAGEKILELPGRNGLPQNISGIPEALSHPSFATAVGLVNFHSFGDWPRPGRASRKAAGSLFGTFKSYLNDLF